MAKTREDPPIVAVVTMPHREGHKGPFFEAKCDIGTVTVSLNRDVWGEDVWPEGGIKVLLWDIRSKRKGWRAYRARFYRPSDEKLFNKKSRENSKRNGGT
ncbi:MAG: hypothetical protein A3J63_04685 [Candidatus Moranbacteria bacterium RIFCSPHIGHO2_02_FULL_40_12b]|nr:MAG: hypothetical protein A3J63_04685 [Candidatus Moranbacteria bacterium RIFCSPHIGHO2_02_FULL_40_12b]